VLDLQAGVHLQEEELARRGEQELDRARAGVGHRPGRRDGRLAEPISQLLVDRGGRGLLDDLLVAALDRALALAQGDHVAVGVRHDLDLDVAGAFDVPLTKDGAVTERRRCLAPGRGDRLGERLAVADHPHAPAAAARGRLDQHGERVDLLGFDGGRQHRYAGVGQQGLRLQLRAHHGDRLRRRADPDEPGVDDRAGEVRVLRQEPVARVYRIGTACAGGRDQQVTAQVGGARRVARQVHGVVGLGDVERVGVGVGVDGDRLDAHRPAGGEHPAGDLAAVGDKEPSDHLYP
jgi:hypothetical protein